MLDAEAENDLPAPEGILVDVEAAGPDVLGDDVPELIHADVVEDLDVLILGDVVMVELVMLDAEVGNDLPVIEGILVDVDVVGLDVLGDDVPELIHADVGEDLECPRRYSSVLVWWDWWFAMSGISGG